MKGSDNHMSEIWNNDSSIEEKHSTSKTPQLNQFKTYFNIRDIYTIIKKYQSNGKIEENDYHNLCWFIDSEFAEQYNELTVYVKELFGDILKDEYFKIKLNNNKDKIQDYKYKVISKYLLESEIENDNVELLKDYLYEMMQKIPELFNSDMISDKYKKKIEYILPANEIQKRDIEEASLNKEHSNVELTDNLYQKQLLNQIFKDEILKNMPQDYSDLEKSIYIYIKLCQSLSYDPNYYANNEKYKEEHQNFENISKIGAEKNNVICYEFVTIYSEMLKDMGINVAATTSLAMDVDEEDKIIYSGFVDNHSNLKYSVDDMVISADSTTSVLGGDIINAKINNRLNGLQCLSVDQSKKEKFNNALNKVYSKLKIENSIFTKYGKDIKEKPLVEKLKILFNDISEVDFNATDFISYITNIKHEIFTDQELDWNLKISYIGRNSGDNQYPVALFSINTNDIKNVKEDTVQYLYDTSVKNIYKLEKEELEKMFSDGELFYIDGNIEIPNIRTSQNNFKNR